MEKKVCPQCGGSFSVYPSGARRVCCSRSCSNSYTRLGKPKDAGRGRGTDRARVMTEVEASWLAGLFDGEGCIALANRSRPGGGTVRITIVNCVYPLIERIVEVTGCGTVLARDRPANPRHNTCYTWQVYGATALSLLAQMRPWLICKAEKADLVARGESFERDLRWSPLESLPV